MATEAMQGRLLAKRYRLADQLGRGGMGIVWRARDELLDRDVAVKEVLLPPELLDEERDVLRQRTLREARSAARLSHPNVVTMYDVVEEEGRPWIVMELVQSRSLGEVISDHGPLPSWQVARIGLQVLAALQAAHAVGVLHRDVKPSNVLLAANERVVLTDFGIATLEGDPSLTRSGTLLGSPAYIAPERVQARGSGPESDLWSLGATLYTAVEGRPPHDRGSALPTLTAAVTEAPDPARLAGPLWPVLEGLLRKKPVERLRAAEARRLLQRAAAAPSSAGVAEVPTARIPATPLVGEHNHKQQGERTRVLPVVPPVATGAAATPSAPTPSAPTPSAPAPSAPAPGPSAAPPASTPDAPPASDATASSPAAPPASAPTTSSPAAPAASTAPASGQAAPPASAPTVPASDVASSPTSTGPAVADDAPAGATASNDAPADGTASDDAPAGATGYDDAPASATASNDASADGTASDDAPAGATGYDDAPASATASNGASTDGTASDDAPASATASAGLPADEGTADHAAPVGAAAADATTAGPGPRDATAAGAAADDLPAADTDSPVPHGSASPSGTSVGVPVAAGAAAFSGHTGTSEPSAPAQQESDGQAPTSSEAARLRTDEPNPSVPDAVPVASSPVAAAPTGSARPVAAPPGSAPPRPAVAEEPGPAPDRRPKVFAAVAALVLLAGAVLGWTVLRGNEGADAGSPQGGTSPAPSSGDANSPAPSTQPSATQPSTPGPNTTSNPSGSPTVPPTSAPTRPATSRPPTSRATNQSGVPAGFRRHVDPTGFSLAVPAGWIVERRSGEVYIREPGNGRFLMIAQTNQPKADPVADWTQQEAKRRGGYRNYQRIRIAPVNYLRGPAADWEFTYTSKSGNRLHVLNRGVVTSDDQAYGIYWSTAAGQWQSSQSLFRTFTTTFQPKP